jgi:Ca2+-transporting ATPase
MNWHLLSTDEIFELTGSSVSGLTSSIAASRLEANGPNALTQKKKKGPLAIFLGQFTDFMTLVLVAAAIISGIAGDRTDAIIILAIVILNALLGFLQQYRAEKAMEALRKMGDPSSIVWRNGGPETVAAADLVTGDIVLLDAGAVVPADLRLLEARTLTITESALTGESVPVHKTAATLLATADAIGDRINIAYKGTHVTSGRGRGIVVATAMDTEIGHIARMLQEPETATPMQARMRDFGKKLSYGVLLICIILFVSGLLRGEAPLGMMLLAISLAVAAIPEALPALITIALSRGAARLAEQKALIRKLTAVETLGSVTFICTDKTGTLTQNKMVVATVAPFQTELDAIEGMPLLFVAMGLNHALTQQGDELSGDPTEIALLHYLIENRGADMPRQLAEKYPLLHELPFDAERKLMTTVHRFGDKYLVLVKGAMEAIGARTRPGQPISDANLQCAAFASSGKRVLAFGFRMIDQLPAEEVQSELEQDLCLAGLTALYDPPRPDIGSAIEACRAAGVRPVMITGDHPQTAAAIARQIGLLDEKGRVATGAELDAWSDAEFGAQVENIGVYARVSPGQKLLIVEALQRRNQYVAMTGDGVNDAPALRKANIGIAMGTTGTDVSKEAAHLILLDDNFATIVRAIGEGRRIYDNIRRFVKYIMTCNSAEIWTIFLAPLLGLPLPLLPVQLLWINLITDGLPGLALSAEKAERNVMRRPPRGPGESLFAQGIGWHILWCGTLMAAVTLGTQAIALHKALPHWQTIVFTVLSFAQLGHVMAVRSDEPIFRRGLFSNPLMTATLALTFLLQIGIIYLPVANRLFKTQPLSAAELVICILVAMIPFHVVELEKWIRGRKKNARAKETVAATVAGAVS